MNALWIMAMAAVLLIVPLTAGCTEPKGLLPQTELTRAAPKAVFAHVMVSFQSRAHSGKWRMWNYRNKFVRHNPDALDEHGRPDVASVYYPSIGSYDQTDPAAVENHCQLAKMAGIDGFIFDLGEARSFGNRRADWRLESMRLYAKTMARYGLKAVICYEDKVHWIWNRTLTTREQAVAAAHFDLTAWLKLFTDAKVQYTINGRPLVMFFSYQHEVEGKGVSRLSPAELKAWLDRYPPERRPVVATQWFKREYKGVINGPYDWTLSAKAPAEMKPLRQYADLPIVKKLYAKRRRRNEHWLESGTADFLMTGAYPGFDDRGCWGWGTGPRLVPREDGKLYRYVWGQALADGMPVVQIATWNDWFEGTNIEPAAEFGTLYLEITREFAAKLKKTDLPEADLNTPIRIYRIRKSTRDRDTLAAMNTASEMIRTGRFDRAERIVNPYAARLKVDQPKFWIAPADRPFATRKRQGGTSGK